MCLAVPALIVELDGPNAIIDIDGIRRPANVAFIEEPTIGDYVIVHAGFAIQKWSQDDVDEFNEIMKGASSSNNQL